MWSGDDDGVHVRVGERVFQGGEVRYAELIGLLTKGRLSSRGDADEAAVVEPVDCVDVDATDHAGRADDCEADVAHVWLATGDRILNRLRIAQCPNRRPNGSVPVDLIGSVY